MYEHVVAPHSSAPNAVVVPTLFLSSDTSAWDGMVVRAYDEPATIEGWHEQMIPDISLVMLTRGSMQIEARTTSNAWQAQILRQGDLIFRPSESAVSELRWHSLSPTAMQTLHLDLNKDFVARVAADMQGPAQPMLRRRSGFQDPLIAQIGLTLLHELQQPITHEALYLQTAAHLIAVHLLSHYSGAMVAPRTQPRLTPRQMQRVVEFIDAHLAERLSLDDLAQHVGFSSFHFARCFRQLTGESPHQFVMRLRVERAQQLLATADMPLTHIASACGFADQSHLTRIFKRLTGHTPRRYRQEF